MSASTIDRILATIDAGLPPEREGTMTQLIQTANGYLLCSSHAEAWQRGGNAVSMWPANEQETEQGGGRCADCPSVGGPLDLQRLPQRAEGAALRQPRGGRRLHARQPPRRPLTERRAGREDLTTEGALRPRSPRSSCFQTAGQRERGTDMTENDTPRTELDMQEELANLITNAAEDYDEFDGAQVDTFENAGVMTYNKGLVVRLANGAEFQLTIVQSRSAEGAEDEDDEVTV